MRKSMNMVTTVMDMRKSMGTDTISMDIMVMDMRENKDTTNILMKNAG
jgi:hypothetical protein